MSDQNTVTERDYIAALRERITLADWGAIIDTAIQDAKDGDRAARDWIERQVIGDNRISLAEIAAYDRLGVTSDRLIAAQAEVIASPQLHFSTLRDERTPIERVIDTIKGEQEAEIERQEQEEKARKRAERETRKAAKAAPGSGANS